MKKTNSVFVLILAAILCWATLTVPLAAQGSPDPVVITVVRSDVSTPLRDMVQPLAPKDVINLELNPIHPPDRPAPSLPQSQQVEDPARQSVDRPIPQAAPTPLPLINVPGLSDDDNAAVAGTRIVPPDTEGDIGPDHYVQWINLILAVWDVSRDGSGTPTSATLDGAFGIRAGNSLWAGFGGPCQNTNDGDPIVIYDHLADRWFLSQFAINTGDQCIAVSTTPDPTGSYFRWQFTVSPGENNDYPKFGLMPNAYYLALRDFPSNDGTFASAVAFDRAALIAGAANPTAIKFSLPCLNGNCPDGIQPPHLEGPPPAANTPGYFTRTWDDQFDGPFTGGADGVRMWEFLPDFGTPANSTFTELPFVVGTPFNSDMCGFFVRDCIPQASSSQLLDPADELQMYRAQFRHFDTHDSLVLNTTVDASGTDIAGVRWFELRNTGSGWTMFQDSTFAPADGAERWQGSAAMDSEGNIALGYSVSSSSIDPGIRYTSRASGDPLGTMPGGEVVLIAGTGAQTGANRWGDYASMSVDPVADCTFWFTTEYYENTNSFDFKTRIGAFQLADCGGDPPCVTNADCSDGLFCNGAEVCNAGTCEAGTAPDCGDGVSCTVDSCNEGTDSCDNIANDSLCDNGLFCDGSETCDAVNDCQTGTAPNCDDGVSCTVDSCNEGSNSCDNIADDSLCDNGLFCDGGETCDAVNDCQAGSDPCTGLACDEAGDVCICNDNGDCDDGVFCNGAEICNAGACQAGPAPSCDDGVSCTDDSCNVGTDSCDNVANNANCDNGLFCDGSETCDAVNDCQAGSDPCDPLACDENGDVCIGGGGPVIWMSFRSNTTVPGVGTVTDEDIVSYDEGAGTWALEFDGSDVGLGAFEIDGLAILPGGDLLLSFRQAGTVGGVGADDSDIVRFTPTSLGSTTSGTFSLYFDGSDVGLTSNGEDVDSIALNAGGNLVVSTQGGFSGTGASGADEDLFLFTGSLGTSTSGSFSLVFDGSDVGFGGNNAEDVDAASVTLGGNLLFSTLGTFSVNGATGADEDIGEFSGTFGTSTSGTSSLRQDLSTLGISTTEDIGSLHIVE